MADQRDRLGGRNGEVWRAYVNGRTQEWIAERLDLSQQRIAQILSEVRDSLPEDARQDWRISALETLGHLHAEMLEIANREAPPAYSQGGKILMDEHGDVVRDVSSRLAAVDRVLKVQERASRLLGLDAPDRVEATVTQVTQADLELQELLREARAASALEQEELGGAR